jgi:hypothetical protein
MINALLAYKDLDLWKINVIKDALIIAHHVILLVQNARMGIFQFRVFVKNVKEIVRLVINPQKHA